MRFKAKVGFDDPKEQIIAHRFFETDRTIMLIGTKNIRVWSVETGELLKSYPHEFPNLIYLKISPDGRRAIVLDMFSGRIFKKEKKVSASVLDLQSGKTIALLERPIESIRDAEWSKDGATLVTYSAVYNAKQSEVCFWDGNNFDLRGAITLKGHVEYKKLLDNGKIFLAKIARNESYKFKYDSEDYLTAWDTATLKPVQNFSSGTDRQSIWGTEILTNNQEFAVLASGNFDRSRISGWKIGGSDLPVYEILPRKKNGSIGFYGVIGNYLIGYQNKTIELYDAATGDLKFSMPYKLSYTSRRRTYSLPSNGKSLVIESCEKAEFFDLQTAQKQFEIALVCKTDFDLLSTSYRDWDTLSFHPSNNLLLTFSDKTVRIWNTETGKLVQTVADPDRIAKKSKDNNKDDGLTWGAGWLANGKYLYARGADGKSMFLWEMTK